MSLEFNTNMYKLESNSGWKTPVKNSEEVAKPFLPAGVSIFSAFAAKKVTENVLNRTLGKAAGNNMVKSFGNIHNKKTYRDAAYSVFKNSILPEKGVSIISGRELAKKAKRPKYIYSLDIVKDYLKAIFAGDTYVANKMVKEGSNAFYVSTTKQIKVNMEKRAVLSFHEMGHALNHNTKGLGNILSKGCWVGCVALPIITLTALLRNKKEDGEKSKTAVGKGLDFIKDNCTALAAASFAPNLLEEGLASIKGYNLAKKALPAAQLSKMAKNYGKAWLTYLVAAVTTTAGVYVMNKVRNATSAKVKA